MNGLIILLAAIAVLVAGYLLYGRHLAKTWGVHSFKTPPALTMYDNVDYVPSRKETVFAHQFASIADAGLVTGTIQAAIFGWVPVLLWLVLGAVFMGGVQDFAALYASVKNKGRTIGYLLEKYIGKLGKRLFLGFVWLFSVLFLAALIDLLAKTFTGVDGTGVTSTVGSQISTIHLILIVLSLMFGLIIKFGDLDRWANVLISVTFLFSAIMFGMMFPFTLRATNWRLILIVYLALASAAPVWLVLQPRDYINLFAFIAMILLAAVGIVVARPTMRLEAFCGFQVNGQLLFPCLFATAASGAVSGFHAMISSGTTSKQIRNERHTLPVSYGAMLVACLVAVIALVAVGGSYSSAELGKIGTPGAIFASAVAGFLTTLGLPAESVTTLLMFAFTALILTTLDSIARVGRLSWQELILDEDTDKDRTREILSNRWIATAITLLPALLLSRLGYQAIWPLFGSANLLLSMVTLLACAIYFRKNRRGSAYAWIPMLVMLLITFASLIVTVWTKLAGLIAGTSESIAGDIVQLVMAIVLFALAMLLSCQGLKKLATTEPRMSDL